MDRRTLLKRARAMGFEGKTLTDLKSWADTEGVQFAADASGKNLVNLDEAWNKTVYITADAGESVEIVTPDGGDEMDGAMADEGEEEDEAPAAKRRPVTARDIQKGFMPNKGGLSAKSWQNIAKRGAYTKAAREGIAYRGGKCVFADGDRAELATAFLRLKTFGAATNPEIISAYASQKRLDQEIVTKAGSIGDNATYGSLVVEEYLPELIENFNTFGAARQVAGVTSMSRDTLQVHRWASDVMITDYAEGGTIAVTDGTVDRVMLAAKKSAALCRLSSELLNDSAIDIANQLSNSIARKMAEFEDKSFFLGTGRVVGLEQTAGADADATYDADNTDWGDWTIEKLQNAKAKLAGWALEDPDLAIVCNPSFYEAVLKVNAYSAGGTPGDAILNGTKVRAWDGVPVAFSHVMPRSFSVNQIVAYIGSFKRSTKFGVVRGSEQMATSNDFYFDTDEVALRFTQRWDYNLHDVTGTNTGVVALKD